jgi:hypothetical protein
MDRTKRRLPYLRVVRVALRRTTRPFSIKRTQVGRLIKTHNINPLKPGPGTPHIYIQTYEYDHYESPGQLKGPPLRAQSRHGGSRLHPATHTRPIGIAERVPGTPRWCSHFTRRTGALFAAIKWRSITKSWMSFRRFELKCWAHRSMARGVKRLTPGRINCTFRFWPMMAVGAAERLPRNQPRSAHR